VLQAGMSRGSTPASTPLRDQLGLNEDADAVLRSREQRRQLKAGLGALPSAMNEYQIMAPERPEGGDDGSADMMIEEDAADLAARQAEAMAQKEKQAMKERSTPLKRKLPRPVTCDEDNVVTSTKAKANDPVYMLEKEMYEMVQDDGIRFPVRMGGVNQADDPSYVAKSKSSLPYFSPEELANASAILKEELVDLLQSQDITKEDDGQVWEETLLNHVYLPNKQAYANRNQASEEDLQAAYSGTFDELRQQMTKEAKKANKLEKKLNTLTAGYQKRAEQLITEIQSMHTEQETKTHELNCFLALQAQEKEALPRRIKALREEVEEAQQRESNLQREFKEKMDTLSELRK